MMWTRFMDMHSGGSPKEDKQYIYIEASEGMAKVIFYNRFKHSPERVTCTCCGSDYSIMEYATLEEASGYDRNCEHENGKWLDRPATNGRKIFGKAEYMTVAEYIKKPDVMVIYWQDVTATECEGDVPEQGYVWRD